MSHGAAYPGIYGPRSVHHAEEAAQEKYEQGNINGVCDITVRIIKPGRWRQHYFPNPQGFMEVMLAPTAGFYDPDSYVANAIDVALFVLFLGGFLGVMNATGAIDTGIRSAMRHLKGREVWMIPILMSLFAIGGTTYGMAEETLAFYAILIPVMMAAGYDVVTGVAIILIGAGIGVL